MNDQPNGSQLERKAKLTWVPLGRTRVNEVAQRAYNLAWATELAADFSLEEMGNPTVNHRGE